jgi:DNA polymerase-3 subunit alpha
MAAIDEACEYGARIQRDRSEGQAQLFAVLNPAADQAGTSVPLPAAPAWPEADQLAFEKETLGLYWSGHPMDRYVRQLREYGARSTAELSDIQVRPSEETWGANGRKPIEPDVSIGGIVAACRQLKTRKGDRMAVFTLEDAEGSVEIVAFPEAYQRAAPWIATGTMVLVRGKVERDDETSRILAVEVAPIESLAERVAQEVAIRVTMPASRGVFEALGEIFSRHRGDRRVSFEIELPAESRRLRVRADVSSQIRVRPSPSLVAEVERVVGPGAVSLR